MSVNRYWRVTGVDTLSGGALEISAFHIYDSTGRVDNLATLSCGLAPNAGSISTLSDADPATTAKWDRYQYSASGFYFLWDFGTGGAIDMEALKIGSGVSQGEFIESFDITTSNNGVDWVLYVSVRGILWPGANAVTTLAAISGKTESFSENPVGKTVTVFGSPTVTWDSPNAALSISGNTAQHFVRLNNIGKMLAGVDAWVEMDIKLISDSPGYRHVGLFLGTGTGAEGCRIFGFNNEMGVSVWDAAGVESGYESASLGNAFAIGSIATVRVERSASGVFKIISGGVTRFTSTPNTIHKDLLPGFFVYGASILVYEVRVGGVFFLAGGGEARVRTSEIPKAVSIAGSPLPDFNLSEFTPQEAFMDAYNGGTGRLYGVVEEKHAPADTPLRRKVLLIDEASNVVIRKTWSDAATGFYEFVGVKMGVKYTILSYDHLNTYRAVIADAQIPEIMQ